MSVLLHHHTRAKLSHILNWQTQHAAGIRTAEPYPHMFQGIPVNASVLEFIQALSKRCPTYKFAVSEACNQSWSGRYTTEIFREVWVYRDGDEHAMGRIGYDNISDRASDKPMFTIQQYGYWVLHQGSTEPRQSGDHCVEVPAVIQPCGDCRDHQGKIC